MKTLILGKGEIGSSLFSVLHEHHETWMRDTAEPGKDFPREFEVMHVCFPYSKNFVKYVKSYQKKYRPKVTVIHSTVPVGTSRKCGAVHSPVVGVHPYLTESIRVFTKFLGGPDASEVADYFRRANVKVSITDKQETTELMKILCTTKYGIDIEYVKDVKRQCDKFGVPFEAWLLWTENYNGGYNRLNQGQYTRPNLTPIMKKIGGHCVLPNAKLLDTKFTKVIRLMNSEDK